MSVRRRASISLPTTGENSIEFYCSDTEELALWFSAHLGHMKGSTKCEN
jgi:hypothetical protein